jgi:multiple sugar transport system permease protein
MISAKPQLRGASPPITRAKQSARTQRRRRTFYLFISPWLLGFIFLSVIPMLVGFLISFTNYDGLNLNKLAFVGTRNYGTVFKDPSAQYGFSRTLIWAAINLPLWLAVSLLIALLVNVKLKGNGIFRTLLYLPAVIPPVALVWTWKILLEQNFGLVNGVLSLVRPGTAIPWLSTYAMLGLTSIALWNGLGFGMIVFLAGLQDIPQELIDAARVDGAGNFQVFFRVILPLISPIIFFQLILGLISALQQFVLPMLAATSVSTKIPARSVYLYMVHVYRTLFGTGRFGQGMAMLWLLIIMIGVLTFIVFWTQRFWVHSEVKGEE